MAAILLWGRRALLGTIIVAAAFGTASSQWKTCTVETKEGEPSVTTCSVPLVTESSVLFAVLLIGLLATPEFIEIKIGDLVTLTRKVSEQANKVAQVENQLSELQLSLTQVATATSQINFYGIPYVPGAAEGAAKQLTPTVTEGVARAVTATSVGELWGRYVGAKQGINGSYRGGFEFDHREAERLVESVLNAARNGRAQDGDLQGAAQILAGLIEQASKSAAAHPAS